MKTGILFRMESENAVEAGADLEESLALAEAAAPAAEEVVSASGAVTEVETGIEAATEAQAEVDGAIDTMTEAEGNGGLTPLEAQEVNARLERACRLLGTSAADMGVAIRRESFGSAGSRLSSTKLKREAAEGLGRKIWEGLKAAWDWLKKAVVELFSKIFKSNDLLIKRLKDIQGRLGTASGNPKNAKLTTAAGFFSIDGKTNADTIKASIDTLGSFSDVIQNATSALDLDQIFSGGDVEGVTKKSGELLAKAVASLKDGYTVEGAPEGSKSYGKLPGGRTVLVLKKEVKVEDTTLESAKLELAKGKVDVASEYDAISIEGAKVFIGAALGVAENSSDLKRAQATLLKTIDANVGYITKIAEINAQAVDPKAADEVKKEAKVKLGALKARLADNQAAVKVLGNALPSLTFETLSKAADVGAAVLSNLKKPEAAAAGA